MRIALGFAVLVVVLASLAWTISCGAVVTELVPFSYDAGGLAGGGLSVNVDFSMERLQVLGTRRSQIPWGLGPVNYVSGATVYDYLDSPGTLDVDIIATGPGGAYGSGTGFKAYVQFWNDPLNFVAIGLIHDPFACPRCPPGGVTLMVEGNSTIAGGPIGGYWNNVYLPGDGHHFRFEWTSTSITITIDNPANSPNPQPLVYSIRLDRPSISFIGGARLAGDSVNTLFQNIVFSLGSVPNPPFPVIIPLGAPYVRFSAPVQVSGSGSGYNVHLHISEAAGRPPVATTPTNNAISIGIQADQGDVNSLGVPYYTIQRVVNGGFTYRYVEPADNGIHTLTLEWWDRDSLGNVVNWAVFSVDGVPIASFPIDLEPRLIFAVYAGARLNGDSVVANVQTPGVTVSFFPPPCVPGGSCALHGSWNTSVPGDARCAVFSCGITAVQTNPPAQQGATFHIQGTAAVPPCANGAPGNWDCYFIIGQALIAQQWFGQ